MNGIEDRLRDAFGAAAETVRPESVSARHEASPRAGRRRLAPLAAAVAVAVVIVAASVITPLALAGGHRAPSGPGAPAATSPSAPSPTAPASPSAAAVTTVPDVSGLMQAQAEAILSSIGLNVTTVTGTSSSQPPGCVIAENPAAGSRLTPGAMITLTIVANPA